MKLRTRTLDDSNVKNKVNKLEACSRRASKNIPVARTGEIKTKDLTPSRAAAVKSRRVSKILNETSNSCMSPSRMEAYKAKKVSKRQIVDIASESENQEEIRTLSFDVDSRRALWLQNNNVGKVEIEFTPVRREALRAKRVTGFPEHRKSMENLFKTSSPQKTVIDIPPAEPQNKPNTRKVQTSENNKNAPDYAEIIPAVSLYTTPNKDFGIKGSQIPEFNFSFVNTPIVADDKNNYDAFDIPVNMAVETPSKPEKSVQLEYNEETTQETMQSNADGVRIFNGVPMEPTHPIFSNPNVQFSPSANKPDINVEPVVGKRRRDSRRDSIRSTLGETIQKKKRVKNLRKVLTAPANDGDDVIGKLRCSRIPTVEDKAAIGEGGWLQSVLKGIGGKILGFA